MNKESECDLDAMMRPVWNDEGKAHCESATPCEDADGKVSIRLLYKPENIISVTSATFRTIYKEGIDFVKSESGIEIDVKGHIPFMKRDEVYPIERSDKSFDGKGVPFIAFSEGHVFHDRQISITYTHNDNWRGSVPESSAQSLSKTFVKIKNRFPLKILIYGDSIATGANASGVMGAPPYQKAFGEMFAEKLSLDYEIKTELINTAVGGTDSNWGFEQSMERAAKHSPDLTIIAFGMNDGSGHVPAETFCKNIAGIMDNIKKINNNAEFILASPMLANPEACLSGIQEVYNDALKALVGEGVALAQVTPIHKQLLSKKAYIDMTGNNVNHPNDYMHRVYTQVLLKTIGR